MPYICAYYGRITESKFADCASFRIELNFGGSQSKMSVAFQTALPLSVNGAPHCYAFGACRLSTWRPTYAMPPHAKHVQMSLLNDLVLKSVEVAVASSIAQIASPRGVAPVRKVHTAQETESEVYTIPRANKNGGPSVVRDYAHRIEELLAAVQQAIPAFVENGNVSTRKWKKLAICLLIDLIGSGSLPIPLLADALDLVTAPLSAIMLHALFGNPFVTTAVLVEELLPGTDGIPTATLAWIAENYEQSEINARKEEEKKGAFAKWFTRGDSRKYRR